MRVRGTAKKIIHAQPYQEADEQKIYKAAADFPLRMHTISYRQRRVPILPYRFVPELADQVGHFLRGTIVGDVELAGRQMVAVSPFAGAVLDDAAADGLVKFIFAR